MYHETPESIACRNLLQKQDEGVELNGAAALKSSRSKIWGLCWCYMEAANQPAAVCLLNALKVFRFVNSSTETAAVVFLRAALLQRCEQVVKAEKETQSARFGWKQQLAAVSLLLCAPHFHPFTCCGVVCSASTWTVHCDVQMRWWPDERSVKLGSNKGKSIRTEQADLNQAVAGRCLSYVF